MKKMIAVRLDEKTLQFLDEVKAIEPTFNRTLVLERCLKTLHLLVNHPELFEMLPSWDLDKQMISIMKRLKSNKL